MTLTIGSRFGPYQIVSTLGEGGMGEVYRAHDTSLGRDVALKVLPAATAQDAERLARFDREARTLASLNHPHIAQIHGVETAGGTRALVMELVEGPTLADRLAQGPVSVDDVVAIARQLADALEAAHEQGIVHRDLKPANLKLRPDGTLKVLDFGLAKAFTSDVGLTSSPSGPALSMPTVTSPAMTQLGVILGTAAYMSPEQARGKPVDRRSDIWAFGCVVYELATGQRPFKGEDITDVLASVMKDAPDLTPVPASLRRLVSCCLEKDPRKRLQHIADFELVMVPEATDEAMPRSKTSRMPWLLAMVPALALAGLAVVHFTERSVPTPLVRFDEWPPGNSNFGLAFALSPDGRSLAFAAAGVDGRARLFVRDLGGAEAQVLSGTEHLGQPVFWSPDGRSLMYSGPPPLARLMRIERSGGAPRALCDSLIGAPIGTWVGDTILYRRETGLGIVAANGGECGTLAHLDKNAGERRATAPSMLPDGRRFLYLRIFDDRNKNGIYLGSLDASAPGQGSRRLLATDSAARFVPSPDPGVPGYLSFVQDGRLMVQVFDPGSLALQGEPAAIVDRIVVPNGDVPPYSFSTNGVLAYQSTSVEMPELRIYEGATASSSTAEQSGQPDAPAFSPDGTRVAYRRADSGGGDNIDIWIHDFSTGENRRLTFESSQEGPPIWTADGTRIAFASSHGDGADIYWKPADGSGGDERLVTSDAPKVPLDFSPDGRYMVYLVQPSASNGDLWLLPLLPRGEPRVLLDTPSPVGQAQFSPDGRYLAYVSNETGTREVYVRPFSRAGQLGPAQIVSDGGGAQPRWRPGGQELLYVRPDKRIVALPVSTSPTFHRGVAKVLLDAPVPDSFVWGVFRWDVSSTGRIAVTSPQTRPSTRPEPIHVILNWPELLKRR